MHARKKLALLQAGSRAETSPRPRPSAPKQPPFLRKGKPNSTNAQCGRPQPEPVKVLVTLGQYVSTFASTTLVQLKPDAK
jgi:hypothetical protein